MKEADAAFYGGSEVAFRDIGIDSFDGDASIWDDFSSTLVVVVTVVVVMVVILLAVVLVMVMVVEAKMSW